MLLIDAAHECGSGRKNLINEDKDGLLGRQLDPFPNHVDELAHGEICWYEILLLVDSSDIRLLDLLADNLG